MNSKEMMNAEKAVAGWSPLLTRGGGGSAGDPYMS